MSDADFRKRTRIDVRRLRYWLIEHIHLVKCRAKTRRSAAVPYMRAAWGGSSDELYRLLAIIDSNCTSESKCAQQPTSRVCAAHRMLLEQRVLNGLVFVHEQ